MDECSLVSQSNTTNSDIEDGVGIYPSSDPESEDRSDWTCDVQELPCSDPDSCEVNEEHWQPYYMDSDEDEHDVPSEDEHNVSSEGIEDYDDDGEPSGPSEEESDDSSDY